MQLKNKRKLEKKIIPAKAIGFEIEFGAHLYRYRSDRAVEELSSAASLICETHSKIFGHETGEKNGCKEGLKEFGSHQFRVYTDHYHAEISSPLVYDAKALVIWQRRAKKLAHCCRKEAEKRTGKILLHCANTNRNGRAWGYHINILISRKAFDGWRDKKWRPLLAQWIPFLVTSPILFGTGKVGSENSRPSTSYQLSQRSDFIDKVVGLETVNSKSLINERDEPLADPTRFARFHITGAFDCNLCEFSSWLKFATVQLMLALIEAEVKLPNLQLKNPLESIGTVSRDLELSKQLQLEDGTQQSALDIQEQLAFSANKALDAGAIDESIVPSAKDIVNSWIITLIQLRKNDCILRRRLDWVVKKHALEQWRQRLATSWDDKRLTELDLRYAEIESGWFERLEREHLVDFLGDFLPLNVIKHKPSSSQRDVARSKILEKFRRNVVAIDWHYVCLSVCHENSQKIYKISLDDPLNAIEVQKAIDVSKTASEFVEQLPKFSYRFMECLETNFSNQFIFKE